MPRTQKVPPGGFPINMQRIFDKPEVKDAMARAEMHILREQDSLDMGRRLAELNLSRLEEAELREYLRSAKP